jgi:micrococcal nuclease
MNPPTSITWTPTPRRLRAACALVALLGLTALAGPAQAAKTARPATPPIAGTVLRVVDGDTLVVAPAEAGRAPITVRVDGIDAPEICQPHGPEARQAMSEMVLQQPVTLVVKAHDAHGRMLARVMKGELDVGDRLVRDGHAWSHRYKWDKGPYVAEERMATTLRRGLHAQGGAVMPREFRKAHGSCA